MTNMIEQLSATTTWLIIVLITVSLVFVFNSLSDLETMNWVRWFRNKEQSLLAIPGVSLFLFVFTTYVYILLITRFIPGRGCWYI